MALLLMALATYHGAASSTTAGETVSTMYGQIVIVGDSSVAGNGATRNAIETTLSVALETKVLNNGRGGASLDQIFEEQDSCSAISDCTWAVLNGGINGGSDGLHTMTEMVSRERSAGRNVILSGYPLSPDWPEQQLERVIAVMDEMAQIAAADSGVYFVDHRAHAEMNDLNSELSQHWRARDNKHPSPLAGAWLGMQIAEVIARHTAGSTGDESEPSKTPHSPDPSTTTVAAPPSGTCSSTCATEFAERCVPYQCRALGNIADALATCREQLDSGFSRLSSAGCTPGCIAVPEMSVTECHSRRSARALIRGRELPESFEYAVTD